MKKFVAILFCFLLPLGTLHSKDITPEYLQTRPEPWVCLEGQLDGDNISLKLWENEKNAFLEKIKDKYYLFSRADFIFVSGENLRIDLVSKDNACLLNKEQAQEIAPMNPVKTNTTLPRPLAINRDGGSKEWIFDVKKNADNQPNGPRVVILREWPTACPACSLVFSKTDNPSLSKDEIYIARGDSSSYHYRYKNKKLVLSKIIIKKKDGSFVKLGNIKIDGSPCPVQYNSGKNLEKEDAYTSKNFAEVQVNLQIQNIKDICVEYSYLNENLKVEKKHINIQAVPDKTSGERPKPIDIVCYILFGLMLLTSAVLILLHLSTPKKGGGSDKPGNNGPTSSERKTQDATAQLEQEKNKNASLIREIDRLNAVIAEDDQKVKAFIKVIENSFGERFERETFSAFITRKGKEFKALAEDYDEIQKMLNEILKPLNSYFGSPEDNESYDNFFSNIYEHIQELESQIEEEVAKSRRELTQKLEEQEERFKKQQLELFTAHQEDTRLYCDTQLALLHKMQTAYQTCSNGIIPSSKFGKYILGLAPALQSFIETAEPIFIETTEKDSIASLSDRFSPMLSKELNDITSWLNALIRLEAYARTEALRKPMLEDGIDLSSLTEFFYAAQELLRSNFYLINPLPALFVDTNRMDDYRRDNRDSVISGLFNYKEVLETSAIVDIIQIGYSYKNNAATQTTITYYVKPTEI